MIQVRLETPGPEAPILTEAPPPSGATAIVEAKKLFVVVQVTSAAMMATWASYPCQSQADRLRLPLTPCLAG